MTRKMLIIGFDGLDPLALERYTNHLDFPHVKFRPMLMEDPTTGPSWTTIYTGKSKAEHKVSAEHFKDWTHGPSNHSCKFLWETLSEMGYRSGLFHLPVTYPPREFRGWQICGFPLPESVVTGKKWDYIYPRGLKHVVHFKNNHAQTIDLAHWNPQLSTKYWIKQFMPERDNIAAFGSRILKRIEYDFTYHLNLLTAIENHSPVSNTHLLFVQWGFLDRLGHIYSNNDKILQQTYPMVIDYIRTLWELFPAEYVVVLSDHGFVINSGSHRQNGVIGGNPAFIRKMDWFLDEKYARCRIQNLWVHDLILSCFRSSP